MIDALRLMHEKGIPAVALVEDGSLKETLTISDIRVGVLFLVLSLYLSLYLSPCLTLSLSALILILSLHLSLSLFSPPLSIHH